MDLILLYRTVILDIIVMLFLLLYGLYCIRYDESSKKFIPFAVICLIYSAFGLITEITVNATSLPPIVNDICHIFYFAFGLLFSFNYLKYVLELVISPKNLNKLLLLAGILSGICIVVMIFSDIIYIDGAGTRYSQGTGPTLCYALGFLFILISDVIIIAKKKVIENSVWFALLPITLVAVILLVIQIVYPLFLFSESAIVLICLGVFFAIEDPVGKFQKSVKLYYEYAYVDGLTGLLNRRSYGDELNKLSKSIPNDIICVSVDLNELKVTNDTLGHDAGDEIIIEAGRLLTEVFGQYGKIFRTGGDEYFAIIRATRDEYEKAVGTLLTLCKNWAGKYSSQLSLSVGAGFKEDTSNDNIMDIINVADKRMYSSKSNFYFSKGIDRRGQAAAQKVLYDLYIKILKINLTSDSYSIISMDKKEQSSEMGYVDTISGWLAAFGTSGQVHEEDRDEYLEKTSMEYLKEYFKSNKTSLEIEYRRKHQDGYKQVAMEMIPADDYSEENQTLFLYVKEIDK